MRRRQGHDEAGAHAGTVALGLDPAAVRLDESARNRKADAAAAAVAGPAAVHTVEALEDTIEVLGRDALSGIGDRERHIVSMTFSAYLHTPALWRMPQGVVEQVPQHLADPVGVDRELRETIGYERLESNVLRSVCGLGRTDRGVHDRGHRDRSDSQIELSLLQERSQRKYREFITELRGRIKVEIIEAALDFPYVRKNPA